MATYQEPEKAEISERREGTCYGLRLIIGHDKIILEVL
jgi:hypothetical protein